MQLHINGESRAVTSPVLAGLLAELSLGERRVAVELNGEIVPRSEWPQVRLREGDRLEIVNAIGGG